MKYFSLFTGIGGFELGIQKAYEYHLSKPQRRDSGLPSRNDTPDELERKSVPICIGYSEIDKYAIQIYEKHFKHQNYGDITKIQPAEIPDFHLLIGGFPCQSFSIAGRRGGFDDTRGTLFFEICRVLREKHPPLLLLENVKGLLSHQEGRTFGTILNSLDELGYDLQWQVLNSKNHGVPQNRERVFIVGHLRGTSRPEVFPFGEDDGEHFTLVGRQTEVTGTINSSMSKGGNKQDSRAGVLVGTLRTHKDGEGFREVKSGLSPTIPARAREDGSGQPVIAESMRIRRLTPIECERLQGFPDGWTEGVSDTQRYKCLGNAVTVNVIRDVMVRVL